MIEAAIPPDEDARLATLRSYRVLDTPPEPVYDRLTELAAAVAETPMALISLIDADRQWFKSRVGIDVMETDRCIAFCAHTILNAEPLVIDDVTADPRFADNPLVGGAPHIRSYAGFPLVAPSGCRLGTLCVVGTEPQTLSRHQQSILSTIATQVQIYLEMRRKAAMDDGLAGTSLDRIAQEITTTLEGIAAAQQYLDEAELTEESRFHLSSSQHATAHLAYVVGDLLDRLEAVPLGETAPTSKIDLRQDPT